MSSQEMWSEDDIRELINEYKRRPILWNENSEIYKDKQRKFTAWKELANMFNATIADIQRRTNNLKSTFHDEEKKMKKMKAAKRKSYIPWVHYDDLKFINGENGDGTSSESEVTSVRDDQDEQFIPMELESTGLPSARSTRITRSTLHAETKSGDPLPASSFRVTNSRSDLGTIRPTLIPTSRLSRTRGTFLSGSNSGSIPTKVTSVVTTTKKRILSETMSDDDEPSRSSPLRGTSTFSPINREIAYYPQLGGLPSSSPPSTASLYPHLENVNRMSSSESRTKSQLETPPRYSPSKVVTTFTATRSSPETERVTKRRKLSDLDHSTYHETSLNSTVYSSPSPSKHNVLVRDGSGNDGGSIENGSVISQVLSDDYDLFGAFVASEIRNLKLQSSKIKLKGMIQRSIVQVSEEDSHLSGK